MTPQLLKSNTWLLRAPDAVFRVDAPDVDGWADLDRKTAATGDAVIAGLVHGSVIALGRRADIERCFGAAARVRPLRATPGEPIWEDSGLLSILREGVVRALALAPLRALEVRRQWLIVDDGSGTVTELDGQRMFVFQSVDVRIDRRGDELYLILVPDRHLPVQLQPPGFTRQDVADAKTRLLGLQGDRELYAELIQWQTRLRISESEVTERGYPQQGDIGFRFTVVPGPIVTPATFCVPASASPSADVAYIGMGYASQRGDRAAPLAAVCGAVFDGAGKSLGRPLSRPAAPIFKRNKPSLAGEDAQAFANAIRARLGPSTKRVVFCRQAPFGRGELDALCAGFEGIPAVDAICFDREPAYRFVPWDAAANDVAPGAIAHGTTVVLDDDSFLLTTTSHLLRVRRLAGSTDVETLARDVLAVVGLDAIALASRTAREALR